MALSIVILMIDISYTSSRLFEFISHVNELLFYTFFMNKSFHFRLLLLCFILIVGACDNNDLRVPYEFDWYPVILIIRATDAEGKDIISSNMPGMSLTFKGESYTVRDWSEKDQAFSAPTRTYFARLYGLFSQPYTSPDGKSGNQLWFGEIDGALDMDEDILLNWPDGSKDVIHYHCSNHRYGKNPGCYRWWKLNGEPHSGGDFTFTGKGLN